MTAREWTIVALRALLAVLGGVSGVICFRYGLWIGAAAGWLLFVGMFLQAFARYEEFRFDAAMRRYHR